MTIREFGVFADQKFQFLQEVTRYDFIEHYVGKWFSARRYRGYALVAGLVGVYFLFSIPLISAAAFAFAAYSYNLHKMYSWYTEGDYAGHRNIILAD